MRYTTLALSLACSFAAAQDASNPLPEGAPPGLDLVDAAGLRAHAEFLASDELRGRYTSSPGQVAAAEYIAKHFEELGLQPLGDKKSYFQHYPIVRSYLDPKGTRIEVGQHEFDSGFAVIPGKKTKKLGLSGFAFAEYGAEESFPRGMRRAVPVVVARTRGAGARRAMSAQRDLIKTTQIAQAAAERGARALVVCLLDDGGGIADALGRRALLPGKPVLAYGKKGDGVDRPAPIPIVYVNAAISKALLDAMGVEREQDEFRAPKRAEAPGRLALNVRVDNKATATNVVAVLEGDDLDKQAVVYSAHMDHVGIRVDGDAYNGADDNASGTSGLLEIAEAFVKCGTRPRRSVVFLAVSGEELGLWGSKYYSENPTWPLRRIVANINIDMIGRDGDIAPAGVVSATPSHTHEKFSTLVREAASIAGQLGLRLSSGDKYYARSDHYNFAEKGVPVVFFCNGEHADYHQVTDHVEKLDFAKMERVARLAYWTGWSVANADGRPRVLGRKPDWTE